MLFDTYRPDFDTAQALRWLHLDADFEQELAPLVEKTRQAAHPRILVRQAAVTNCDAQQVTLDGQTVQSRVVAARLAGLSRAFCYVATCGAELDALAGAQEDPLLQYWQQALNERVLHLACVWTQAQLCDRFDLKPLSAVNPGSNPDWPIQAQAQLFDLIGNVTAQTGVTLGAAYWMHPVKSTSGIWFEGAKKSCNCQLCLRRRCVGRRMPFDPQQYRVVFGALPVHA